MERGKIEKQKQREGSRSEEGYQKRRSEQKESKQETGTSLPVQGLSARQSNSPAVPTLFALRSTTVIF